MMKRTATMASIAVLMAGLAACGGSDDPAPAPAPAPPPNVAVGDTLVLTESAQLVSFNRATPGTLVGMVVISGLATDEVLHGIDIRPADGHLYALGSSGRLYTIVASTGVATVKASLRAASGDAYAGLSGTQFGVDFNPVADRLRVVSNTGQNLRINVDTGDVISDGALTPASGTAAVSAAAYTNSFAGASSTALFDLDASAGVLLLQDPPNSGTLGTGVALGVTPSAVNGFDIEARNNVGYAALTVGGSTGLYTVNLGAGAAAAATLVGTIPIGQAVRGLALVQPAAPSAVGLTTDNRLVGFDPRSPTTLSSTVAITGLGSGESVLGIDVRPADRLLYALTNAGRIYTVDPSTGVATAKSTLSADPGDATLPYGGLAGTRFSVDFNPVADRLRVIGDQGQSLRINVDTGATTTDGDINRASAPPRVIAAAYSNSFAGTAGTVLYDMEANSGVLARQDPPNNGTLVDIGALGVDVTGLAAFDIAGGANGLALAAIGSGAGPASLYAVSLTTGALTLYRGSADAALSRVGGASGPALRDIAIRF